MSEHINLLGFFIESGMSVHDVVSLFLYFLVFCFSSIRRRHWHRRSRSLIAQCTWKPTSGAGSGVEWKTHNVQRVEALRI